MRRLILVGLAAMVVILAIGGTERAIRPAQAAWLCPKKTDYVSGFNRICVYRCPTGDVAMTIGATEMCPISIQN